MTFATDVEWGAHMTERGDGSAADIVVGVQDRDGVLAEALLDAIQGVPGTRPLADLVAVLPIARGAVARFIELAWVDLREATANFDTSTSLATELGRLGVSLKEDPGSVSGGTWGRAHWAAQAQRALVDLVALATAVAAQPDPVPVEQIFPLAENIRDVARTLTDCGEGALVPVPAMEALAGSLASGGPVAANQIRGGIHVAVRDRRLLGYPYPESAPWIDLATLSPRSLDAVEAARSTGSVAAIAHAAAGVTLTMLPPPSRQKAFPPLE